MISFSKIVATSKALQAVPAQGLLHDTYDQFHSTLETNISLKE